MVGLLIEKFLLYLRVPRVLWCEDPNSLSIRWPWNTCTCKADASSKAGKLNKFLRIIIFSQFQPGKLIKHKIHAIQKMLNCLHFLSLGTLFIAKAITFKFISVSEFVISVWIHYYALKLNIPNVLFFFRTNHNMHNVF